MEIDRISELLSKKSSRRKFLSLLSGGIIISLMAAAGLRYKQEPIEIGETNQSLIPEKLEVFLSKEENLNRVVDISKSFDYATIDQAFTFPETYVLELPMTFQEQLEIKTINFSADKEGEMMILLEWAGNQPLGEDFQKSRTPWPAFILGYNSKSEKVLKPVKGYQTLGGEKDAQHRYLALMFPLLLGQESTNIEWILLLNRGLLSSYSNSIIFPLRFHFLNQNNQTGPQKL